MNEQSIKDFIEAAIPIITDYGMRVIGAVVILILGKIVAKLSEKAARAALTKGKVDQSLVGFLGHMVNYAILTFALIAALGKFGVETTSFIAVLGAAGLAVGLALQGSLSNFAAGVLILIFRPFSVNDLIEGGGHLGTVKEIGIFTTTLSSLDNRKIIIPNSVLTGGSIVNLTGNDTRRVDMTAGISYKDDIGKARDVILGICSEHPLVLKEPAPQVEVVAMADSSVNLVVRPWCKTDDYWGVYFDVMRSTKEGLERAGITIPFPQRDVHLFQSVQEN